MCPTVTLPKIRMSLSKWWKHKKNIKGEAIAYVWIMEKGGYVEALLHAKKQTNKQRIQAHLISHGAKCILMRPE